MELSPDIIKEVETFSRSFLEAGDSTHDWWHTWRVRKNAHKISQSEGGEVFFIDLVVLLHDVVDWKLDKHILKHRKEAVSLFLKEINLKQDEIIYINFLLDNVSFKGTLSKPESDRNLKIIQDADRLDAIGAIGIARAFSFGGLKNREIYNPFTPLLQAAEFANLDYRKSTTINHFYEKLLTIYDSLHTVTARKIAKKRHSYTQAYLKQFMFEWEN